MLTPDLILKPFAASAAGQDIQAPPQTSPAGFVNFTDGYTSSYEISLAAGNPAAKAVERPIQNYLFNALTRNSQAWQAQNTPPWYAGMVGGYIKNAQVLRLNGSVVNIYRSLVDGNIADPVGNPTFWEYVPTAAEMLRNVPMPSGGASGPTAAVIAVATDFNAITTGTYEIKTAAVMSASPNSPNPPYGQAFGRGILEVISWDTGAGIMTIQRFVDESGAAAARSAVGSTYGAWKYTVSYRDIQSAEAITGTMAGGPTSFICTLAPNPAALYNGMEIRMLVTLQNEPSPTLNLNGLGSKPIIGGNGTALARGELMAGRIVSMLYSTTSGGRWVVNGQSAGPLQITAAVDALHAAQATQVQNGKFNFAPDTTSSASPNAYGATYTPAVTALTNGLELNFQAQLGNNGPSTFSPNGLPPKPIVDIGGNTLFLGAIVTNGFCQVTYSQVLDSWVMQISSGGTPQSSIPMGSIMAFPKGTVPAGFLELDGSLQNSAILPELSLYLGTTYNTGGEPAGFFRLPDTRGEFIRGWDHGRGIDVSRALGSWQVDLFKSHLHNMLIGASQAAGVQVGAAWSFSNFGIQSNNTNEVGGGETRGRNIAFMHCIKAFSASVNQGTIDVNQLLIGQNALAKLSLSSSKGLYIAGTGKDQIIIARAKSLVLGNGPDAKRLDNFAYALNLLTVGIGGLDAGVPQVSSWYSIWAATNGATSGLISALMPLVNGNMTAGSPVVTGIASTSLMKPGMSAGSANLTPGTFILSVDSSSQITLSLPAIATLAAGPIRFVYEPAVPAGYVYSRIGSYFTDATPANKFPLTFFQIGGQFKYKVQSLTNVLQYPAIVAGAQGTPTALVAQNIQNFFPPFATTVDIQITGGTSSNTALAPNAYFVGGLSGPNSPPVNNAGSTSTNLNLQAKVTLEEPKLYYYGAGSSGAQAVGFEDDFS